jgi:selenocysteine lyase/cysteine desulfurase
VLERGVAEIRAHEVQLAQRLIDGLSDIPGVTLYGPRDAELQTATVSFTVEGLRPDEVGQRLDADAELMCRVGLHCAPAAHKTLGTYPSGTVRFGLGAMNVLSHVEEALSALQALAGQGR